MLGLSLRLHSAGGHCPARGTKRIRHSLARGEAKLRGPPVTMRLLPPNASHNGGTHELDHELSSALPLPAFSFPGGDPFSHWVLLSEAGEPGRTRREVPHGAEPWPSLAQVQLSVRRLT